MKFKEAMNGPDSDTWKEESGNEDKRMVMNGVWEPLDKNDFIERVKAIKLTWACKNEKQWYILWLTEFKST